MMLDVRVLSCISLVLVACGARTELGVGVGEDASAPDVHVADARADAHVDAQLDAPSPCTLLDITGTVYATTDDAFVLYVNDTFIDGTPHLWSDPQEYTVTIHRDPSRRNTIAVQGTNTQNTTGRDRGVLLDLRFTTEAGQQIVVTNGDWRLATNAPASWYLTSFDDSSWQPVFDEGPYPEAPWGTVFAPFGIDTQAPWLWSYDSNQPANAKVVQETVFVRRDFYIDASGHVTDAPSACK